MVIHEAAPRKGPRRGGAKVRRSTEGRRRAPGAALLAGAALAGAAFAGPGPVSRAGAEPLPLPRAIEIARESNPGVRGLAASADAARAVKRQASASRWPALQLRESALRTDSPADAFGLQLMQERFSFPAFTAGDPNDPATLTNYATELGVTMPLFTGGRLGAGIRQADRGARAAAAAHRHAARSLELQVSAAYAGVILAGRMVELAERALATTERHLEEVRSFHDAGMIVESDLLQAEVQRARMEEARIDAVRGAALARLSLNRTLGVDSDRRFELPDSMPPASPAVTTLEEARRTARTRRDDLAAAEAGADAARAGVRAARGSYWPEIGLAATWSWNDDRPFGTSGASSMLGAFATWDVWDWGRTRAAVSQRQGEYRAATEALRGAGQAADAEVQDAWLAMDAARARRHTAEAARGAAERALVILEDRFQQGIARTTELLDAETLAHETRVNELRARFDLDQAIRRFNLAAGFAPVMEAASR